MHRLTGVIFLLAASLAFAKTEIADETAQRINRDVTMLLARTETPGATILALRDGKRVYSHAFGQRDRERRLPAGMDTHYEIGSITKQFTAAAILQLKNAGRLNIDAKVAPGAHSNLVSRRIVRARSRVWDSITFER